MNIYSQILKTNLPKLFNIYNLDRFSATCGYGDRLFWGWKASDFSNGTMQGGIHSLAIAVESGLTEDEGFALEVIDSVVRAVEKIRSKKGAMQEVYPNENSFCVTGLVAFDILATIGHLGDKINKNQKKEYLGIVGPLVDFISRNNEEHGIISNHLATAAAAVVLWNRLNGSNNQRYREFLDTIYRNQSEEGWYREYEGADPAYQTLCLYYLSLVYEETKDAMLKESIIKSADFLRYFVHPDGTIGGLYGSRNTEVYYPAGIVGLSGISDSFAAIAKKLQQGIRSSCHIYPGNIDISNFVPLINSYSAASLLYEKQKNFIEGADQKLPYERIFEKEFNHAGIFIKSTLGYYAIVNYKKGGVIKVFNKKENIIDTEDGGLFGKLRNGLKFSTQAIDDSQTFGDRVIKARFYKINEIYPTPFKFIILRCLSQTVFRFIYIGNLFKRFTVKMLITGKRQIKGNAIRRFNFLDDKIIITEEISQPRNCGMVGHFGKAKSIHMASSGYYNKQRAQLFRKPAIVEFK